MLGNDEVSVLIVFLLRFGPKADMLFGPNADRFGPKADK